MTSIGLTPQTNTATHPVMAIPDNHRRVSVDLPSAVVERLDLLAVDGITRGRLLRSMLLMAERDEQFMGRVQAAARQELRGSQDDVPKINPLRRG